MFFRNITFRFCYDEKLNIKEKKIRIIMRSVDYIYLAAVIKRVYQQSIEMCYYYVMRMCGYDMMIISNVVANEKEKYE